jgi:RNA polymerase sigma factor (sigma-70 family)
MMADEAGEVGTGPPHLREQSPSGQSLTSLESLTGQPATDLATEEFTAFYRAHTPRLVAFLLMQGTPRALAVELVQEVMTDLWRHWETVKVPKAWTRTAATRAWIRYRNSVPELPVHVGGDSPLLRRSEPHDESEVVHAQHELLLLLAMLPERQRHVMALIYDDWTPAQIATELGITEATVRATIRDARKALRQHRGGA